MTRILVSMPEQLIVALDRRARQRGISRSALLRELAEGEARLGAMKGRLAAIERLAGTFPAGTDAAQMIREERDQQHRHG